MVIVAKKVENKPIVSLEDATVSTVRITVMGITPFIMHRFAFKAWQELMAPVGLKNNQAKVKGLKHYPLKEYQECFYLNRDPEEPAMFHIPTSMIQGAITAAALDIPGIKRTEAKRWISVTGLNNSMQLNLFGIPKLYTTMVRNSDINRTPDTRTRPIFEQWVIPNITITFKEDPLNVKSLMALANAAGQIVGCGDWRPQTGGSFGKFRICNPDDEGMLKLVEQQNRIAQEEAYYNPKCFDKDTEDINKWFIEEMQRRGTSLD